jgi:pantoate--beta-alanine ligase
MSPTEPRILRTVYEQQRWSDERRREGRRVALVPTMGALHTGHLSLVQLAHQHADRVVVSIFVNPTQFGPNEDYERYPRDLNGDIAKLRPVGVDVVFAPTEREMYPSGNATWVEVARLADGMCGRSREGHFRGVATVVTRLLNATKPHVAVFGEKDYQQLVVIRRLVRDLRLDVEVVGGATVRELDGLAMSSRNAYLRSEARRQATSLNAALIEARQLFRSGCSDAARLIATARRRIEEEPLAEVEYVEVRDAETLEETKEIDGAVVIAVAARFEGTRLIDNTVLEER